MKTKILILFAVFSIACNVFAESSVSLFNKTSSSYKFLDETKPFELKPALDIPLTIATSSIAISAGVADVGEKIFDWNFKDNSFDRQGLSKADLIIMDQIFMTDYNKALSITSTVTEAMLLASPAIVLPVANSRQYGFSWEEIGIDGTMYAQTMMTAWGIKEWLKLLVDRPRPYMYYDNYPESKVADGDWNDSFPSGHTTLSFAAATFLTYTFFQYYPDDPARFWVLGLSYGTAVTTAALRMASGNHFFTDVMTGALIGTVCGITIPYLHTQLFYSKFNKNKNNDLAFYISPTCLSVSFSF